MTDQTDYNGWKNYETWRVNLEMFDGMDHEELRGMDRYSAGLHLRDWAENYIEETTNSGLGRDWALAFLQPVDWWGIADHYMPESD